MKIKQIIEWELKYLSHIYCSLTDKALSRFLALKMDKVMQHEKYFASSTRHVVLSVCSFPLLQTMRVEDEKD